MISFIKMQGLGNDFVVIDVTQNPVNLSEAQIKKMADRRYGIGFDQLLLIEKNSDGSADFNYRIFNADGSESYQCGNGARCVARYIIDRGLSSHNSVRLKTKQVFLSLRLEENGWVEAQLDPPKFNPPEIPFVASQHAPPFSLEFENEFIAFYVVNVGNPHAVIFQGEKYDFLKIGAFFAQEKSFPEGINTGFVEVINPHEIQLKVYERGVGPTLACGSGACAAAVAGIRANILQSPVKVTQPGGDLFISWQGDQKPIIMKGPAEYVFEGKYATLS